MDRITDEDIALFLKDENIRDILNSIDSELKTQTVIVNLILYLFNSSHFYNTSDWIQRIIFLIKDKALGNNMLAPSIRNIDIESSLNYIVDKLHLLENNEEVYFDGVCVTYDSFNEFIDSLYDWFLEMNIKNLGE